MASVLVVNDRVYETRVALMENDDLVELYIERSADKVLVGSIYKGRVIRVLPGMDSAFIDIGMEKAAFLSMDDIRRLSEDVDFDKELNPDISDVLKEGQEILVQISKEPIGTKGPRVTTNVSLAGRYLVLAPVTPNIGISRKIEDKEERERLKKILKSFFKIDSFGMIARTASNGVSDKLLKKDYDLLVKQWQEITKKRANKNKKGLLHTEVGASIRFLREIKLDGIDKIVVDNQETHKKLLKYLGQYNQRSKKLVEFYDGEEPVFESYGIEHEIERSLGKRVWLKSGGYIIIDQTDALVVIDVNTGRYVGSKSLEETVLKTNLEAVKEIAYQLRLRNLGGIIVLDLIDMEKNEHKEKVLATLKESLKKDRAKTNVFGFSELGLVQMTRKRTRESIIKNICDVCHCCEGKGFSKSYRTVAYEIFRELERYSEDPDIKKLVVYSSPQVLDYVYQNEKSLVRLMEKKFKKSIIFEADKELYHEQYEISLQE